MMNSVGLYIHIPFCLAKCNYCDFNSYPQEIGFQEEYLEALLLEISCAPQDLHVESIFLGGGTPTILTAPELCAILDQCHRHFHIKNQCEISIEANPDTITRQKVKDLYLGGFNRISMGVQSLDDGLLRLLGRTYETQDIYWALEAVQKAGFSRISIDLIYGLPGQELTHWKQTLNEVQQFPINHLSCYSLQVEENTALGRWEADGAIVLPNDEVQREMLLTTKDFLEQKGWIHYEIANFARLGEQSRHNLLYWHNRKYLGFGAGAHSFWQKKRRSNLTNPKTYIQNMLTTGQATAEEHLTNIDDEMDETAFLGLRLMQGVDLVGFQRRFGQDFQRVYGKQLAKLESVGLIKISPSHVSLTRQGLPVANLVFAHFIRD